jgi:hypothetical protein
MKIDAPDKEIESIIDNIKKQNLITDLELREQLKRDALLMRISRKVLN